MNTTATSSEDKYNYGILMVSTTWNTFSWHIIPTSQDYYRIGFLGLKYLADPFSKLPGPLMIQKFRLEK